MSARIIITRVGQSPRGHSLYTWRLQADDRCLYVDNVRRGRGSVETRIRIFKAATWKILDDAPGGNYKWSLPSPFGGDPVVTSPRAFGSATEAMEAFAAMVAGFDRTTIEEEDQCNNT